MTAPIPNLALMLLPSGDLRPWIRCWVICSQPEATRPSGMMNRLLAQAPAMLSIFLRGRAMEQLGDGNFRPMHREVFSGPQTRPMQSVSDGDMQVIAAVLVPGMWQRLVEAAPHELVNLTTPAANVLAPALAGLGERLHEMEPDAAIEICEAVLRRYLDRTQPKVDRSNLAAVAMRGLLAYHPIRVAAYEMGCSPRQFERRFHAQFGLLPKSYQRLARFDRLLQLIRSGSTQRLSDVAADLGYFDQTHLSRDCRAFAGVGPNQLRESIRLADPDLWSCELEGPELISF